MPPLPEIDHVVANPPPHLRVINRLVNSLATPWVTLGPSKTRICRELHGEPLYCGPNLIVIPDMDPDVEPDSIDIETDRKFVQVVRTVLDPWQEPPEGKDAVQKTYRRTLRIYLVAQPPDTDRLLGEARPKYVACKVRIAYNTTAACWHPKYEFSLETATRTGKLVTTAYYVNQTEEVWHNCRVTFSTSALTPWKKKHGPKPPLLEPWMMQLRQLRSGADTEVECSTRTLQEQLRDNGTLHDEPIDIDWDDGIPEITPDLWLKQQEDFRETLRKGQDIEWVMDPPWRLEPTPKGPVRVHLGTLPLENVSFHYTVVPKYDTRAYMSVTFHNTSTKSLIAAPVKVIVDNNAMASTTLAKTKAGEKIQLDIGPDPFIAVDYKTYKETVNYDKQLGQGQNYENVTRVCWIANLRKNITRPTRIIVVDQLPMCDDPRYSLIPAFPSNLRIGGDAVEVTLANMSRDTEWGAARAKVDSNGEVQVFITLNPYKRVSLPLSWHLSVPGGYRLVEI